MADKPHIIIYDTTLRDGTQGENISFTVTSKLRLTEKLDQFGIDYIEGGWPGSNPRDMAYFEEVAGIKLEHAKVAAFGSTRRANQKVEDDPQIKLLLDSNTPVITIFGKSWLLHVLQVLRTTEEENLLMIEDSVRFLVEQGREVIYDAEHFFDGYADNPDYAVATLEAAAKGGALYLVLCDTNGGRLVDEIGEATAAMVSRFPDNLIGTHCHNDSGVGVAVSLSAVMAGATMVHGTMNGYGERNGNANLTSIIPNLALKLNYSINCAAHLSKLRDLSLFVDDLANLRPDIRAPYVGASSFAHKGGVHANAASKVARSYEHIEPALVGNRQRVLISDLSGRSSIMMKAHEIGIDLDEKSDAMKSLLEELKDLEFRGYEFESADASFKLLLNKWLKKKKDYFELISYKVTTERDETKGEMISEASVKLKVDDEIHHTVAKARGPVGALDNALRQALAKSYPCINEVGLRDYKVRILDSGKGANSRILVQIESSDGKEFWGTVGASDNIIEASWEALKDSVEYKLQQEDEENKNSQSSEQSD